MNIVKIMPCLDIKEGRVVKGIKFNNLRDAGNPVSNAKFYEREGADELAVLDIAATIEGKKTRLKWVRDILAATNIPLTVGGGISNLNDVEQLFELGVNKISINTAAVRNPQLIKLAAERFGREKIVIAIDGRREARMASGFEVVTHGGTTNTGIDAVEWAKKCEALGAGELLLTSIDYDGTEAGYDLEFIKAVSDVVSVPVIASGGAGKIEHLYEGVVKGGATTLLAASIFHFRKISIKEAKEYLKSKGLKVKV